MPGSTGPGLDASSTTSVEGTLEDVVEELLVEIDEIEEEVELEATDEEVEVDVDEETAELDEDTELVVVVVVDELTWLTDIA